MECLVKILLWSSLVIWTNGQFLSKFSKKEVFFVNLEEGFFGCQVNETTEVLQIFKVEKLCDGKSDCYLGSDENQKELKCSNNCLYTTGHRCINGACLDSQCHCNDGWGGKGCSMPDDNECKYRPCDVFAHCTNNIGSYACTCFPGYEGDGHTCQDIDECTIPELAAKCVENAECCNLPAEYVCKCKPGFEGDGQVECRDIDECRESNACGANSLCTNFAGNYTCSCQEGYAGDPYTGCLDLNECLSNPCGSGAKCINQYGGYLCECPAGAKGDPYTSCGTLDQCQSKPCGLNAKCYNDGGSYRCECPQGFQGNPKQQCLDVNECLRNPCGKNAVCINTEGSYQCGCKPGLTGDPFTACSDTDECSAQRNPCGSNAVCRNTNPGFVCECPPGFSGNGNVACEATEVRTLCKSNFDCTNNAVCQKGECLCRSGFTAAGTLCLDVDECRTTPGICGANAVCRNTLGSFTCSCLTSFVGSPPSVPCSEPCKGVTCSQHAYCKAEAKDAYCVCEDGWTYDPKNIAAGCIDVNECGAPGTCGENSLCTNLPGSFICQCKPGYTGNPQVRCIDIDECKSVSTCGFGTTCQNLPGSYKCGCPAGSVTDPSNPAECISVKTCNKNNDCPGNAFCSPGKVCVCPEPNQGPNCESPCANIFCAANSQCTLINGEPRCMCHQGYQPAGQGKQGCIDINECLGKPCGKGAFCENTPGGYRCKCPSGLSGDPNIACKGEIEAIQCSVSKPCPSGELCSQGKCVCQRGFQRESSGLCRDVDECTQASALEEPACGLNAFCKNLPGSFDCECPAGYNGNPFVKCSSCNGPDCGCQPPYSQDGENCVLAGCKNKGDCSEGAECITIAGGVSYCACPSGFNAQPDGTCVDIDECLSTSRPCGFGALCENKIGSFSCVCPIGTTGDPYSGVCSANQAQCSRDNDCRPNEKCVEPGQCICPPPFFSDTTDGGKCKSPCERFMCGINADCSPTNPPQCLCKAGYNGDPIQGCLDVDECAQNPCGPAARCLNEAGSYKCQCPKGTRGDPYLAGCKGTPSRVECTRDEDCPGLLSCQASECINPCSSIPCGENAVCIPENHAAWCRCKVGYKENSEGKCTSMCDGVICGLNAQCIISPTGPTCACSKGTLGNPFPGGSCVPETCSGANPCPQPLSCISGKCRERCDSFSCGLNAACDANTNKCFCTEGFVGDGNFLCMPPILPPICTPGCGPHSHCAYGIPNQCVCNSDFGGNPYEGCSPSTIDIVQDCKCGNNAECVTDGTNNKCTCREGFDGNPFIGCLDINECTNKVCGTNAVCINTFGGYDCRCELEHKGNPFLACLPEQPAVADLCTNKQCGPNAVCSVGQCLCLTGFKGDAEDLRTGCQSSTCSNNLDCGYNEICQSVKGQYRCIDACGNVQCGPNSRCVTDNHHSTCICQDGYSGNPLDLSGGCVREVTCKTQNDCPTGSVCSINISGKRSCVDPCRIMSCGKYEICSVKNNRPFCQCSPTHIRNPVTGQCEIASVPSCSNDDQCSEDQVCRPDSLGILRCTPICQLFTCPQNSQCRASNHQGFCQCFEGYNGNPNDRTGCSLIPKDQCQSDAQCSEEEVCSLTLKKCIPACNTIVCGPQAVCITQNHSPQCTCPPGKFKGDPNDPVLGCKAVSCLTNSDCPPTKFCDRLSYTCMDVCTADTCGKNAVCLPEQQRPKCSCPPGTKPDPLPEVRCSTLNSCSKNPCHSSARCSSTTTGYSCSCPQGQVGDPYKSGCFPEGSCPNGDRDCPDKSICISGMCKNICYDSCGPNTECSINNRQAQCQCLQGFIPSPLDARTCIRDSQGCRADVDCIGGSTCQGGQCRYSCRGQNDCLVGEQCSDSMCMISCISSQQCPSSQVCSNGVCSLGCRNNQNCPADEVCISFKCVNPCQQEGACGPNALCKVSGKNVRCSCPERFAGVPTPQQGCVRIPARCPNGKCPAQHTCKGGMCHWQCQINANCAKGERCLDGLCTKVCHSDKNCLQGEICIDSTCQPGCNKEEDCRPGEICQGGSCVCAIGFINTPAGCQDINECENSICHPSANCANIPGSFKCTCPRGLVGDPYTKGCKNPNECTTNRDCGAQLACAGHGSGYRKCVNPCDRAKCGKNANCEVQNHKPFCKCFDKHVGNPSSPLGCTKVECEKNTDCSGDRVCQVANNRCIDACSIVSCGRGTCSATDHVPTCRCEPGYIFSNNQCVDIDECQNSPCEPTAVCINTVGAYQCQCPPGTVPDAFGRCRSSDQCLSDNDCPKTAACNNGKCQNPCEIPGSCGADAICTPANHRPMCSCPPRTNGNPEVRCVPLECVSNSDCASERTCVRNKCVDVCSLPNVCGQNTNCRATNHIARCFCLPGFTGEPTLGCTRLWVCTKEEQCPAGMLCTSGICSPPCQSSRECLDNQLCNGGSCVSKCQDSTQCPPLHSCQNGLCIQESRCSNDVDCDEVDTCVGRENGLFECEDACAGPVICGRNAQCTSRGHKAVCTCPDGFFGDPNNEKIGCQKKQCLVNGDCPGDSVCDKFICTQPPVTGTCTNDRNCQASEVCDKGQCKDPCGIQGSCGINAFCSVQNHRKQCVCPQDFTGNPEVECVRIPSTCYSSSDCPQPMQCADGICMPPCSSDENCAINERCLQGLCMLTCRVDNDCFLGHVCLNKMCIVGCRANSDCPESNTCINNRCTDPCRGDTCGPNAKCQVVDHRAQCSCPLSFIPNPTPVVGCVKQPQSCSSNGQCPERQVCDGKFCKDVCFNDKTCLVNEVCDNGICKPLCRRDDDCNSQEICRGVTCVLGCRSSSNCPNDLACINNQCTDPCSSSTTSCGTNAICSVENHRAVCSCPAGLTGDPVRGCRHPVQLCSTSNQCRKGYKCVGGVCAASCSSSNENCLLNEVCVKGTCRPLCNSNADCSDGYICKERFCVAGCSSDSQCKENQACINSQCQDPCLSSSCGQCAECSVTNHQAFCSCPATSTGNPSIGCLPLTYTCGKSSDCGRGQTCEDGVCVKKCGSSSSCECGKTCVSGQCRQECTSSVPCPQGHLCKGGTCLPGCVADNDCSDQELCLAGKCQNPCLLESTGCAKSAECRVANHRPVCLCPQGLQGNPKIECKRIECRRNSECEHTKSCIEGSCVNLCLLPNACGISAQCKSIRHQKKCACPQKYVGNPNIECIPDKNECLSSPCGENAICQDLIGGYDCKCKPGCTGDGFSGCVCGGPLIDPCRNARCGLNALCTVGGGIALCVCPANKPNGDPLVECTSEKEGKCRADFDCPASQSCKKGKCIDPCSLRAACGVNAICTVRIHKPRCECPQCHIGRPHVRCRSDPSCNTLPTKPQVVEPSGCRSDKDCSLGTACNRQNGQCFDPCGSTSCDFNKKCIVSNHKPKCKCKYSLVVDQQGVLTCPDRQVECRTHNECPSNLACNNGRCKSPCDKPLCPTGKECQVLEHKAVCICTTGCNPEVSICLKDRGCPRGQACIGYQCKNPCEGTTCPGNTPCIVEDHKAVCKFCPPGFTTDANYGCIQGVGCRSSSECPSKQACQNKKCVNPCGLGQCGTTQDCEVANHQARCIDVPRCECSRRRDCLPGFTCEDCECVKIPDVDATVCDPSDGDCFEQCTINSDCPEDKYCDRFNRKCLSVCPGFCGDNTQCRYVNHNPICSCKPGFDGNPDVGCSFNQPPSNPCVPSPCGTDALCELDNGNPICSCPRGKTGNPFVRCIKDGQKCRGNQCGPNSGCRMIADRPVCYCLPRFEGNPPAIPCVKPMKQCKPNPCGANTECVVVNNVQRCTCKPGFTESVNTIQGCIPINEPVLALCEPGPCGDNAECLVTDIGEDCRCNPGFGGNPFQGCTPQNPCNPSPCGPNTECNEDRAGQIVCSCRRGYQGDPTSDQGCRAECLKNSDCSRSLACIAQKCIDPCPGTCGVFAVCEVQNHNPICSCPPGTVGDPFSRCTQQPVVTEPPKPKDPCNPSPCGVNAQCRKQSGQAICQCIRDYQGDPLIGCKPECLLSFDCPQDQACINSKCKDPCPGTCGINAECQVSNHNAICKCHEGYTGDPFAQCSLIPGVINPPEPADPCQPSPCGPNAECRVVESRPVCTCFPGYYGAPPACRPECVINSECAPALACINLKCSNPCVGVCGISAKCDVVNHNPICSCPQGYVGDPFSSCRRKPDEIRPTPKPDVCNPNPCGPSAISKPRNGVCTCKCPPGLFGDPYLGCRPECILNSDCSRQQACSNNKCVDPCPGTCGINAECKIINHIPTCGCRKGFTGNAFEECTKPKPVQPVEGKEDPCGGNFCGAYSTQRVQGRRCVCSCLQGYFGFPPNCRPECVVSSDCSQNLACLSQSCKDPCPGRCGVNARCHVISHHPICTCPPDYEGDPFTSCQKRPSTITPAPKPSNPCIPSPCGPYSSCKPLRDRPMCSCKGGYTGSPPNCRPECIINDECNRQQACSNQHCINPCDGACGLNAECSVRNHLPICKCPSGYNGDPFRQCNKIPEVIKPTEGPINPCFPSPCGANANCSPKNRRATCSCIRGYFGDPYSQCRPECVSNSDCPANRACSNLKCIDPCPGTCGINARCQVVNHIATCTCSSGFRGDPFTQCVTIPAEPVIQEPVDPCNPDPCGPNSECRAQGQRPVCTCLPGYFGGPPNCRPECLLSSECQLTKACVQQKCADPCPGTCGANAECKVVNHNPICSCPRGYSGDPFFNCAKDPEVITPSERPHIPCVPSPCGPNALCREVNGHEACSCHAGFIGSPPNCRPECVLNAECPSNKACIQQKCSDPCVGACGYNARCAAVNHNAICTCPTGYTGDPFSGCSLIPEVIREPPEVVDPCNPSPCGANAECSSRNRAGACRCIKDHIGDPYVGCRPECLINTECPNHLACTQKKCRDPCPGSCGRNAQCSVRNHNPICTCNPGYSGDPTSACQIIPPPQPIEVDTDPCDPNPCGPNSQKREVNGVCVCACLPTFQGSPPNCRPECIVSSDCNQLTACVNQKCVDPCPGTCGNNARCQVTNHNPICQCPPGFTGDPFSNCVRVVVTQPPPRPQPVDPCNPTPCGPFSQCRNANEVAACSCLPNYIGIPPNCRPECSINAECPSNKACVREKCIDPCPGSCGPNAVCNVQNHQPICSCPTGFSGDPFRDCRRVVVPTTVRTTEIVDPCEPSPCGANARCRSRARAGACTCVPGYFGDPYLACRPECVMNTDCPTNRACVNNKCVDPCPGVCGINAICNANRHQPICTCLNGYTGDAITQCSLIPTGVPVVEELDPCDPNPCGAYSQHKEQNGVCVCSCERNMIGSPPNCRPECLVSSECSQVTACMQQTCRDPCPGLCGFNAECRVTNHNPICTCNRGYEGDPFSGCTKIPVTQRVTTPRPTNPCQPTPCGRYSQCKDVGGVAACSCLRGYVGVPPNCRPECLIHSECASNLACINEKCRDPCPGACGAYAECSVIKHNAVCRCQQGYEGDPFSSCRRITTIPPRVSTERRDPCQPSPCGANALCSERNFAAACTCIQDYFGDPYVACRPECTINADCPSNKACQRLKCIDPCPGLCGVNAQCKVINHIPTCTCDRGYIGDPFTTCRKEPLTIEPVIADDPCDPNPCGPNSNQPRQIGDRCHCTCLANMIGSPPNCRPECVINSDCPQELACISRKCQDPCPGLCGINAYCRVRNHIPICVCNQGYEGDPFSQCRRITTTSPRPEIIDPCRPSPCGINAECQQRNNAASCKCVPGLQGNPYIECKPECTINQECASNLACMQQKCRDPCPGVCGVHATCSVNNHYPNCQCDPGYTGDPFNVCYRKTTPPPRVPTEHIDPCNPSPCGSNANCQRRNGAGSCQCIPEYFGDPYVACRPECVVNSDCPSNKACQRNKCIDPCPGTCGVNAICTVKNHIPICTCIEGYIGDPFTSCRLKPIPIEPVEAEDPCDPNPCGQFSNPPRNLGDRCDCSCLPGMIGSPPNCRPECQINRDCPDDKACKNQKCIDPCPGLCGYNAKCRVRNHIPICVCITGYIGDPFVNCYATTTTQRPIPVIQPCNPSPCGINADCTERNRAASCKCIRDYIGNPYVECKPECITNNECPRDKACVNQHCVDPCPGVCGAHATCQANNHRALCRCDPGYTGDAFISCQRITTPPPRITQRPDPCNPSPCGSNALCTDRNGAASCKCIQDYFGDPYVACRPECTINADCPSNKACSRLHCVDPCPGLCGVNAQCRVINHIATCTCIERYEGDPFTSCRLRPIPIEPVVADDPCDPNPCGPNSLPPRDIGGRCQCNCMREMVGSPPNCRPECVINSDCPSDKACISRKCQDPCPGLCGQNAYCRVRNHIPICVCNQGYEGDPFSRCTRITTTTFRPEIIDPCNPSPCGTNAVCNERNKAASCTCLPGLQGNPYIECKPECTINQECPVNLACIANKCKDPCPGVCGTHATCSVNNHYPNCRCDPGYEGDPFSRCYLKTTLPPRVEIIDPCNPSPCGSNAVCTRQRDAGSCRCIPEYFGDPYVACRPECVVHSDCPSNKACQRNKCIDPCPGTCGINAVCKVQNHIPTCTCIPNYIGDPFTACRQKPIPIEPVVADDPCDPNPCGPYSNPPRNVGDRCDCSCLPGMIGSPPNCRPECIRNADCPTDKACRNQKCIDPCPGLCGRNAHCDVRNHIPICVCDPGYIGDPFSSCYRPTTTARPIEIIQPCNPSPCGRNAECSEQRGAASCRCIRDYIGNPYIECKPECIVNAECPNDKACLNQHCRDPCPGVCGVNAKCYVTNHYPNCRCDPGYTGDAFVACQRITTPQIPTEIIDPCNPSPCGSNAICTERNRAGSCRCIPEYFGDPYVACRPECTINPECPSNKACRNLKCVDPCPGLCGVNAECRVINHLGTCTCLPGYRGDPFTSCQKPPPTIEPIVADDPCDPNPCGDNALPPRQIGDRCQCSCLPQMIGSPPNCRPECVVNSDCSSALACINRKCQDPCPGLCGQNAYCRVRNHVPICVCNQGYIGDPFTRCVRPTTTSPRPEIIDPCRPSPCGINAECRERNGAASCTCLPEMFGNPYIECKPECSINPECPTDKACVNQKCVDPCPGVCGSHATCRAQNHNPVCTCDPGYTGDPFRYCTRITTPPVPVEIINPCNPSPCGSNANCQERNGAGSCRCIPDYFGDPYVACRPECVVNSDCPSNKACQNLHCVDPCPGTCGVNAICSVLNHIPTCTCFEGYIGDPFTACRRKPIPIEPVVFDDPCDPNPCGPNSNPPRVIGDRCHCTCLPEMIGSPPNCRPECVVNADCPTDKACINRKCQDPCPGLCGVNAKCSVRNHVPICICIPGFIGDPFAQCYKPSTTPRPIEVIQPCNPSPCGVNAECSENRGAASCRCILDYVGNPYVECKPECTVNSECPRDKACINNKCGDPCPGVCGAHATCSVTNHVPLCKCDPGYTGNAFVSCSRITTPPPRIPERVDPCNPSPCGSNAVCQRRGDAAACQCIRDYFGDPYVACRPECTTNAECPSNKACQRLHCVDPCPNAGCGVNAQCQVVNHIPNCVCLSGYIGDPFTACRRPPRRKFFARFL